MKFQFDIYKSNIGGTLPSGATLPRPVRAPVDLGPEPSAGTGVQGSAVRPPRGPKIADPAPSKHGVLEPQLSPVGTPLRAHPGPRSHAGDV